MGLTQFWFEFKIFPKRIKPLNDHECHIFFCYLFASSREAVLPINFNLCPSRALHIKVTHMHMIIHT